MNVRKHLYLHKILVHNETLWKIKEILIQITYSVSSKIRFRRKLKETSEKTDTIMFMLCHLTRWEIG